MKSNNTKHIYLIAGVFIALVATYIGFTILRRTHEGLSDGASTTNDSIVELTRNKEKSEKIKLAELKGNPTQYINLLTSFKNSRMAQTILDTVSSKNGLAFESITDYDEVIDYLKTLGVSDTVTDDIAINDLIIANKTSTSAILDKLSADNQAYIDLLTSFKNSRMAQSILDTVSSINPLRISDYEPTINYLRTLGGILVPTKPHVSTTRDISLSS
jgi:hypothetical protein